MNLSGKRILVTGGAVRIGRAIVEAIVARGGVAVVHYRRSGREAEALVESLQAQGGAAFAVQAALDDAASCEQLIGEAAKTADGLDGLVNNAAVFHKDGLLDTTEAGLQSEMTINAFVPLYLTRAFARLERDAKPPPPAHGRVVNLLDRRVAGQERGAVPYLLSKKMLAEFTRLAALELAPGITVNAVAPGPVLPPPGEGPERTRELAGTTPLQMAPPPAAVADAVVWLLEADAVTGQTIFVDSGQHLEKG